MSSRNNSSFTGLIVAGTLSVLAAGLFSLLRPQPQEDEADDVSKYPPQGDSETPSDEGDSVGDFMYMGPAPVPDEEDAMKMGDFLEELGLIPNEVFETVAEITEDLSSFREALEMLIKNGEIYDQREIDLAKQLSELEIRVEAISQQVEDASVVPVKIVVSPDAIPRREKDVEVLNAINDSIQDLHTRIKTVEGAIRQVNAEVRENIDLTDTSLNDISRVLEETREQVAGIVGSADVLDEPEETCDL